MHFEFMISIKGEKLFTVEAGSLEEAVYLMCNTEIEGEWCDMDYDIDSHETMEDFLKSQHD